MAHSGGEGVADLLARDRKEIEITNAFEEAPPAAPVAAAAAAPAAAEASTSSSSASSKRKARSSSSRREGPKSREQRQADMAAAADADTTASRQFKRCKEAIDAGLLAFQSKDFEGAIDLFNLALELPGNGAYRLSGSPREYACPSDAEEHAALYNMACCYAQMGQKAAALTCLESILESGFTDVATIQSDPDLRPIQGPELSAVVNKYTGIGGIFTKILGQKKDESVLQSDKDKNKPWLLW